MLSHKSNIFLFLEQIINSSIYFLLPVLLINTYSEDVAALYYIANNVVLYFIVIVRIYFFQSFSFFGEFGKSTYLSNLDTIANYVGCVFYYLLLISNSFQSDSNLIIIILVLAISDLERVMAHAKTQTLIFAVHVLVGVALLSYFGAFDSTLTKVVIFVLSPYVVSARLSANLRIRNCIQQLLIKLSTLSLLSNVVQIINVSIIWWLGITLDQVL